MALSIILSKSIVTKIVRPLGFAKISPINFNIPSPKLTSQFNSLKRKFNIPFDLETLGSMFQYLDSSVKGANVSSSYVSYVAFVPYVNGNFEQVDGIIYLEYHTRTPVLFRNVNIDAYELVKNNGGSAARLIEEKFRSFRNRTSANAEYTRRIKEYEEFKNSKK